jgi:hypothetical protein
MPDCGITFSHFYFCVENCRSNERKATDMLIALIVQICILLTAQIILNTKSKPFVLGFNT